MLRQGWDVPTARNGLLLLMVLFENVQAGNSRSETRSLLTMDPLRNPLLFFGTMTALLLHAVAMYTPGVRGLLRVEPVPVAQWATTIAMALSLLVTMELYKAIRRSWPARGASPRAEVAPFPAARP
jgi:magnesium-transporting ATPase (P-type)